MIKVGMIGCGGMGNAHAPVLMKLSGVKVVGVCDLIEEKARAMSDKNGIGRFCTDYHELLPDVDALWICTEPFNRVEIVTTCAKAKKHIFTEKPIARSLAEAEKMIAVTKKAKVKYMLGYCLRFWQMPYVVIHDIFASGELGDLVSCWMRRFMPMDPPSWYKFQEKSGGAMLDFASHDIDWLRWVGGDVKTVFGATSRVRKGAKADDHGAAMFIFKKGGSATVEDSWAAHTGESSVGIVGTKGSIIMDNDGKVRKRIGYDGPEQIVEGESVTAVDPKGNVGRKDAAGKIRKVISKNEMIQEHFFRCINEDFEPLTSGPEGRKTLLTVMALWESSRTGKAIEVDSMIGKKM